MSDTTYAVKNICVMASRLPMPPARKYNMRKARLKTPALGRNFIRQWREHRHLTLVQLAERVPMDKGNLSKIERSQMPYNQGMLERLAEELQCEPASLLMRDPSDPEGIWSIWDRAEPGERRQIVGLAETLLAFRGPERNTG